MEIFNLPNDVAVFGKEVKSFPSGVNEAFDELTQMIPGGFNRSYYGIVQLREDGCMEAYYAAAEESFTGEAAQFGCEVLSIEKGEYIREEISNWRDKTASIKDVFQRLMQEDKAAAPAQLIEWYQNEQQMFCMFKIDSSMYNQKETSEIFKQLKETSNEFTQLLSSFSEEDINRKPAEESWSAAQVATHVIKSDTFVAKALDMPGKPAARKPDERVDELAKVFLNFTAKLQSPVFIMPEEKMYKKEQLVNDFMGKADDLTMRNNTINVSEMLTLPPLGDITKLELLYFVTYHTQRHIHQLKNIFQTIHNY